MDTAHISFQSAFSHHWGTLVSWSAWFTWDLTIPMSIFSPYSTASSLSVPSQHHLNFSDAAFLCTLVFQDSISETQGCMHAVSAFRWPRVTFHCNTRLIPLSITLSSAKLICLVSCNRCSQQASSTKDPLLSTMTLVQWLHVHSCPNLHVLDSSVLFWWCPSVFEPRAGPMFHHPCQPL